MKTTSLTEGFRRRSFCSERASRHRCVPIDAHVLVIPEVIRTFLRRSAEEYPMGVLSRSPGCCSGADNGWQANVFRIFDARHDQSDSMNSIIRRR
jgi:hypothetical protein